MCDRRKVEKDLFPSVPFPLSGELAGRGRGKALSDCHVLTSPKIYGD